VTKRRILFEGLEDRVLLDAVTCLDGPYPARSPTVAGTYHDSGDIGKFTVPTFDDLGGARTLQRVLVEVTITLHDGRYVFDNEDDNNGATVTLSMSMTAENFTHANGALDQLTATALEQGSGTVTVDEADADEPEPDGPGNPNLPPPPWTPPNFTGLDSFALEGRLATDPNPVTDTDSDSLVRGTDNLNAFILSMSGATVDIDFDSNSGYTIDGNNLIGLVYPLPPPSFFCSAQVTYEYTPEPILEIKKGIVATDGDGTFTRSIGPPGLTWTPPTSPGQRWSGGNITSAILDQYPIDSDLTHAQQGDLVTYAVVIQNRGGGIDGAFNVQFRDTIPAGMAIPTVPTGLNLRIFDGAGDEFAFPGGYTLLGSGLFDPAGGIELTDPGPTDPPGGALDYYDVAAPDSGRNLVVITYDMVIADDIADKEFTNVSTVYNAASEENPQAPQPANVLTTPLSDPASVSGEPSYVTDVFDRAWWGGVIEELPPSRLVFQPLYSGTAEPGSTLTVSIYDARGDLIGSETTVADAGGNWLASFFKTVMQDEPHSIVIRQSYGGPSALADAGFNFRTYFAPAMQGGTFISEHLTVENVVGKREAANAVGALYEAGIYPIVLGWHAYSFEFLTAPATASGI